MNRNITRAECLFWEFTFTRNICIMRTKTSPLPYLEAITSKPWFTCISSPSKKACFSVFLIVDVRPVHSCRSCESILVALPPTAFMYYCFKKLKGRYSKRKLFLKDVNGVFDELNAFSCHHGFLFFNLSFSKIHFWEFELCLTILKNMQK